MQWPFFGVTSGPFGLSCWKDCVRAECGGYDFLVAAMPGHGLSLVLQTRPQTLPLLYKPKQTYRANYNPLALFLSLSLPPSLPPSISL